MSRSRKDPSTLLPNLADAFSIDIREWKRQGKLQPGTRIDLEWFRGFTRSPALAKAMGKVPSAVLCALVRAHDAVLLFARSDSLYSKLPVSEEAVTIEVTPNPVCAKTQFRCPGCSRKVYILYAYLDVKFRCAKCVNLRHPMDRLSAKQRKEQRLARLNDKLGVPAWLPLAELRRPKYMHKSTFERLRAAKAALEAAGIRVDGHALDEVEARRWAAERQAERDDPRFKGGVLHL